MGARPTKIPLPSGKPFPTLPMHPPPLNISAVERETGISKEVLRKWESRYGFPRPDRDALGERVYPPQQVARLRLIKRLLDAGQRPAKVVPESAGDLADLARDSHVRMAGPSAPILEEQLLDALRGRDLAAFRRRLDRLLLRQGLAGFVMDCVAPLTHAVGEAWARGDLAIHEEHLYSEVIQNLLRGALDAVGEPGGRPRVLLTTPPEEVHGLGLLMVASLLALEGAQCLLLGVQCPLEELALAARTQDADVVVLSFSIAYPRRRVLPVLTELRQRLPERVAIWAGGAGTVHVGQVPAGIVPTPTLESAVAALARWRADLT